MAERDQTTPDFGRIWLEPRPGSYPDGERNWCQHDVWAPEDYSGARATEYVRADLVRRLLHAIDNKPGDDLGQRAAADAWIALRKALANE